MYEFYFCTRLNFLSDALKALEQQRYDNKIKYTAVLRAMNKQQFEKRESFKKEVFAGAMNLFAGLLL